MGEGAIDIEASFNISRIYFSSGDPSGFDLQNVIICKLVISLNDFRVTETIKLDVRPSKNREIKH